MSLQAISGTDLARNTREVMNAVRQGRPAVVQSDGKDEVVLVDALDYRLLRAVVDWAARGETAGDGEQAHVTEILVNYFDETISLGKAAERLGISRFELMKRFRRLRIPLRLGPATLSEARAEVATARQARAAAR